MTVRAGKGGSREARQNAEAMQCVDAIMGRFP